MKKIFLLFVFVCLPAIVSKTYAQQAAPAPISGDKDLRDTNIKSRSIDLERTERDARKNDKSNEKSAAANSSAVKTEDKLAAKYDEIKTDYEQIQLSQDTIVKAYQGSGKIDYAQIGKSALDINKSAARLNSNLFPVIEIYDAEKEKNKDDKKEKETKPAKTIRDLIIDLDNTIASFATSSMFQNLRTVDAAVSEKARLDLEKIIGLSAALAAEAQKMNAGM